MKTLYVSNLKPDATDDDVFLLFMAHGDVVGAQVLPHVMASDGSVAALVEMKSSDEGDAAIAALDSMKVDGRHLRVAWATPEEEAQSHCTAASADGRPA